MSEAVILPESERRIGRFFLVLGITSPILLLLALAVATIPLALLPLPLSIMGIIAALVAEALFAWILLKLSKATNWTAWLGFQKASAKSVFKGIGYGVLLYLALQVTSVTLGQTTGTSIESSDTSNMVFAATGLESIILLGFFVPFVAPFFEEVVFRGVLRNVFERSTENVRIAKTAGVVAPALLFSVLHFQGLQDLSSIAVLAITFLLGVVSGRLAQKSQSVWPSIALHVTYNAMTVGVALLLVNLI